LVVQVSPALSVPTVPVSTSTPTIGSGPDVLALSLSEDAFNGNAQFTVAVDGKQIGGVETVSALRSSGSTQTLDVDGSFSGSHTVSVNFLNDAYQFSSSGELLGDRNLYVNGAAIDGTPVPGSSLTEDSAGPQSFTFNNSATVPVNTSPSTSSITPLTLQLSEDAYMGNAQFIYSIDGGPASAPQAVTAIHGSGQSEAVCRV
jgi:hypothetical protein